MMKEETQAMTDELLRMAARQDELLAERERLGQELARLAEAVAAGRELPALLSAMIRSL
jgi:hypothetical protein